MVISDQAKAESYLQNYNYYRLAAYWLPFEADHTSHAFLPGTNFQDVIDLYHFDRLLRLHVLRAIEAVEISARARFAYYLGLMHNPHALLDSELFDDEKRWSDQICKLLSASRYSEELFVAHFRSAYVELLPPVWAVCELLTLGELSRWFSNLKPSAAKTAIAGSFDLKVGTFGSWLHALTPIRNTCAHHCRLWNRSSRIKPETRPVDTPVVLRSVLDIGSAKVYNHLAILAYFMKHITSSTEWRDELKSLLGNCYDLPQMGFPPNWHTMTFWK